ncbi:Rrf2 family transcriptional regulator [Agriterribacter sp.]|uniref:RrF2 family transcriptional regulator n=1 Tax=Agriterribacter sp. TaxID=2821509 RepID=UPI002C98B64E|nr:Rrf2 family transcriptional regulator [Agriterribacter sp.]HTN06552.1 Rrf2 family transcriptional regulator [Agriterribacter sp.]
MFSKACKYGIKAIIYIATQSLEGKRVKINDVVDNCGSPEAFTGKILGSLVKYDIVHSHTGPNGGFQIESKKLKRIKVSDIVLAIDGASVYNECSLGFGICSNDRPCPMHTSFVKIKNELRRTLETTTIYDLAVGCKNGLLFLTG